MYFKYESVYAKFIENEPNTMALQISHNMFRTLRVNNTVLPIMNCPTTTLYSIYLFQVFSYITFYVETCVVL